MPLALQSGRDTDIRVESVAVYFLPVRTRTPLKFGAETLTEVCCCRSQVVVSDAAGRRAKGWGETPLSAQWGWPSPLPYEYRADAMQQLALRVAAAWARHDGYGHPLELGSDFLKSTLPALRDQFNATLAREGAPTLAALIAASAVDIAVHDAYGNLYGRDVYDTYSAEFMNRDLAAYLTADDAGVDFVGTYPTDYLQHDAPTTLPVWHLVGGLDPLTANDVHDRPAPADGHPWLLADWIRADGLRCLKVKLRGNDAAWDYERLVRVAEIALPLGVDHLSADFNCTVEAPAYVNEILDRLRDERAEVFAKLLYVEQPFPYDLEARRIDVGSVAARKPIFLDESAHDWRYVRLGRSLGWSGVCLKTCKTQTGSILSFCWARAHGMLTMVQDLTNPMLAQIPHVRLASKVHSIMGVESNAMQFYPDASRPEAAVHPGLFRRRGGQLDLSSVGGSGLGYRVAEIDRRLPAAAGLFHR